MKNVFVGNLACAATEDAIRSLFEPYGGVRRVSLIIDRATGQPKSFGFIEMNTEGEAQRAIAALNGAVVAGAVLRVKEVPPKEHRRFRGGEYRLRRAGVLAAAGSESSPARVI
jgi:RNA recognition motif-containing protein